MVPLERPRTDAASASCPGMADGSEIRWFEVEPGHVQHFWNAWDVVNVDGEVDRIELSGSRVSTT